MSERKQKRFWKTTTVAEEGEGFAVALDHRRIKTPAKAALLLPTRVMAEAVAAEWDAQEEKINPLSMPVTRSANAAIDKVRHQHAEVAEMLAAYGDTDLLCYRAESPAELVARQSDQWDPALDWAHETLGARLIPHCGVIHQPQSEAALANLAAPVHRMTEFELAAFHDLVSLSGSLVLGFAAARNWRDADDIWHLSRLDEIWQEDQWGADEEAQQQVEIKRRAFLHAKRFMDLCQSTMQ
ncbi:ATP12 family chaperone protein [Sedimentitalea todarodis]|uniref:ATP12 family protein n=1 Tax=Sedimentitalea todarodis TaxID=1631240 RepID=A0ABU3VI84_9RHOB|nr:ATP12 family protein [Sedimentitalea todarodis]MDU9005902.1 ATP12 family protein [Sedimentitalea todarodis]